MTCIPTANRCPIEGLPLELFEHLLDHLGPDDVYNLANANLRFHYHIKRYSMSQLRRPWAEWIQVPAQLTEQDCLQLNRRGQVKRLDFDCQYEFYARSCTDRLKRYVRTELKELDGQAFNESVCRAYMHQTRRFIHELQGIFSAFPQIAGRIMAVDELQLATATSVTDLIEHVVHKALCFNFNDFRHVYLEEVLKAISEIVGAVPGLQLCTTPNIDQKVAIWLECIIPDPGLDRFQGEWLSFLLALLRIPGINKTASDAITPEAKDRLAEVQRSAEASSHETLLDASKLRFSRQPASRKRMATAINWTEPTPKKYRSSIYRGRGSL